MIAVTGATGNVGRELVNALHAAGEEVLAISRTPATFPAGVTHVPADLTRPETLPLEGVDTLFLLMEGDPEAVLSQVKGMNKIVLLSSQGAGTRPGPYHHAVVFEEAVRAWDGDWTILRPGGFNSNAFAWARTIGESRTAHAPFGDVGLPTIDPRDIAEVAAITLTQGGHTGAIYELTGPELTTPRQRAAVIGDLLASPVRFVEQTPEEAGVEMLRYMPEPVVTSTLQILGTPTVREQRVSPDVKELLGRAPRPFVDWAARNIEAFRGAGA
ncbi:NAD(P)H-binding protein [Nonomuraea soli]|uniref:Uncharacterized protein YbjT (DUF2867 family) n=1 Tax=Nonomuraea soli TaxID=1032476 RepID=A0A7W0CTB9_9ACTN|nr:NAD(P)H-binding protein [Nonomuraea soli]MBA2896974.1 uncharacterized protein YbjT (DUF2867 family) [Nonomuraea soli]